MLASAGQANSVSVAMIVGALVFVAGCDRPGPHAMARGDARRATANESAYHPAPALESVARGGGRVVLSGRAQPSAPVRLATPDGHVSTVITGRDGVWRVVLPPSPDMRLYSLSMIDGGRIVQSEGYLALAPDMVAQLRAGAGATIYGATEGSPRVTAVDFDSKGGCVVSGVATPGRAVAVRIDGVDRGGVRADATGRLALALNEPIAVGPHALTLVAGERQATVTADITPPGPMPSIPLRATRTTDGWRVDWTTPGGGLQTTLLFATAGGRA